MIILNVSITILRFISTIKVSKIFFKSLLFNYLQVGIVLYGENFIIKNKFQLKRNREVSGIDFSPDSSGILRFLAQI